MQTNPFDLTGKVALVTGANTGLGQGMALALAKAGADIVLIGRSEPTETVSKIDEIGVKSHSILTDLGSSDNVADIVSEAVSAFGRADILVNNAGIIKRNEAIDFTPNEWDAVMDVNLRTLFFLSQAIPSGRWGHPSDMGGAIVFLASAASDYVQGITLPVDGGWLSR